MACFSPNRGALDYRDIKFSATDMLDGILVIVFFFFFFYLLLFPSFVSKTGIIFILVVLGTTSATA